MKKLLVFLLVSGSVLVAMDDAKQANFCVMGKTNISVVDGDLLNQNVQAIVNPANEYLNHAGGLAAAISDQAGPELQTYCNKNLVPFPNGIGVGNAVISPGFNLKQPYIIHTVAPNCNITAENNNRRSLLKNAYQNALKVAQANKIKSLAFPALGIGIFGYPKEEAAQIAVNTIKEYVNINNHPDLPTDIRLVIKNDKNYFKTYCDLLNGKKLTENKWTWLTSPYFLIPTGILTLGTLAYSLYAFIKKKNNAAKV